VIARGYRALKFDPFGTAWKDLSQEESEAAIELVAAVREAVGPQIAMMIEFHGRLSVGSSAEMIHKLESFGPAWCEEPVTPENLDLLAEVKRQSRTPIAAGERLYTLADFYRLTALRAAVRPDGCGSLREFCIVKIAAMAAVQDMRCSHIALLDRLPWLPVCT
jgi:galactonate dehydratase